MTFVIEKTDPFEPQVRRLLEQSHALMTALFPQEACHFLDLTELQAPHIHLFCAFGGEHAFGTGALALMPYGGEIKSMFTDPNARGQGVADAMLTHLIDVARTKGIQEVYLETGVGLEAAHRLYHRHGFSECGPFGAYPDSPYSIFMHKTLTP